MIRTGKFPQILKIQKITPIKKPQKNPNSLMSYRPICQLQVFEKMIEKVLKKKIEAHFEDNNIILEEHHGGRKAHSTISAKVVLDNAAHEILDQNKYGIMVSTDLTSAFDVVDHQILKKKLRFYGIKGKMMKLLESYLTNRKQYVEVQTQKLRMTKSLECSIIQGSVYFTQFTQMR